jgi:hypothetical protein
VERELAAFSRAIAAGGGALDTIIMEIRARERRRKEVHAALAALDRATVQPAFDRAQILPRIHTLLADWRGLAARHVQQTRQLLRKLLVGRLRFTPDPAAGIVRLQGEGTLGPLVGMLQLPLLPALVAPTGFEPVFQPWVWALYAQWRRGAPEYTLLALGAHPRCYREPPGTPPDDRRPALFRHRFRLLPPRRVIDRRPPARPVPSKSAGPSM